MKTIKDFLCVFFFIISLALLLFSCDDFVDVSLPHSQLTAPAVFEDFDTADAAMTNVYSKMRDNGMLCGNAFGLSLLLGNYTDELDYYGVSNSNVDFFYTNALFASNSDMKNMWTTTYNHIYAANSVVYGVENSLSLSTADRNQLIGEALFARGLLHFYLVNLYGDVPYITSTDYIQNSTVSRMPVAFVYDAIKADLEKSVNLLTENYIGNDRVRPNKFAAHALLARLNLYAGLWEEAANDASAVLNATGLYIWQTNIDGVFNKNSSSTIWQFSPAISTNNTQEGNTFLLTAGPPKISALTSNIMMSFSSDDLRKTNWVGAVTDGATIWYYPNKYKLTLTQGGSQEHSIIFRLSEMYLIRSEARAHQGDLIGAKEDLNKVRNRAGLTNTTATTANQILTAVLNERRLEFFTEFGHRFFDLKRTGTLSTTLSPLKSGWDDNDKLLPLPASELLLNPNLLPQNPGY